MVNGNRTGPIAFTGQISRSDNASYQPHNGVFTAPVNGTYFFTTTLSADAADYLKCYIVREYKDYLVEVFISDADKRLSASSSVVVDLAKGDRVAVTKCMGNATLDSYKSSFSGFLIKELP